MSQDSSDGIETDPTFKNLTDLLKKDYQLEMKGFLGKGSYSVVMRGYSAELKKDVAIKVIDMRSQSEYVRRFLPREVQLVRNLKHENVVRVYQVIESLTPYTVLVTEFCEGGDLLQKIKKMKRIPESDARVLFKQLINALIYLQANEIVHRDLKCENVFLDKNDNIKLGDFGFARYIRKGEQASTFCGSRAYVAPEILRAISYTGQTVDIWSAGIVLYVMVTGVMPYDDRNPQKMVERQLQHKIKFPKVELSVSVKALIYEILHPFPPSRPSYKTIKESVWMREGRQDSRQG